MNALILKKNTNFLSFWPFWAPLGPFGGPPETVPGCAKLGLASFIIVCIKIARRKKNLERISQNMMILGQMHGILQLL